MTLSFLYLCSLFLLTTAANDWNKPCFSGVCEYDLPSTNGRSSGTLTIWGPASSIGDITPAAGWAILNCSQDALRQTIRMACIDDSSPDCAHLFGGNTTDLNGPVGKLVRIPETCGKNAFGFVTKASLHDDQSIPVGMVSSLSRRDGTLPTVHGLHISTNVADWGPVEQKVHFSIRATNIHAPHGDTSILGRRLTDINFDKDASIALPSVDVNQNFTVIDETIQCLTFRGGLSIHVDTKSHAVMTLSIAASGTILPPKIDTISLTSNISTNIDAIVDVKSNVGGTLNLGEINLYEVGLPGLDFPGILKIGPSFKIVASAKASLDAQVDMRIGINYNINQTSFTFPPRLGHSPEVGSFEIGDTPLKLNSTPSVNATGTVSLHLIPSLNFGIRAFGEHVNVFANVDTSVSASLGVTPSELLPRDEPPYVARKSDSSNDPPVVARAGLPLDGCFEADTRISVNVGADADFFDLFKATAQVPLYTQSFQLFKKCFGSSSSKRSWPFRRELPGMARKPSFDLQCFPLSSQLPETIVDSIMPASNITKILDG